MAPLFAIGHQNLSGAKLGLTGERIVARALGRSGWHQLGRRLATADAELDLLMLDGETLVGVEVKTGRSKIAALDFEQRSLWRPGHRFGPSDLARVRRATQRIADREQRSFRVDLIELVIFESSAAIFHHFDINAPLVHPQEHAFGRVLPP